MAQQNINDSLYDFLKSDFINTQLISSINFNEQIQLVIFNRFLLILQLIRRLIDEIVHLYQIFELIGNLRNG